jgi:hypothetical protein
LISILADKLKFLNESNTTISPDLLKIKIIQGIFKQNIKPKCQIKWEKHVQYGGNIDWTQIWTKLKKINFYELFGDFFSFILENSEIQFSYRLKKCIYHDNF